MSEMETFFSLSLDMLCIIDKNDRFVKLNKAWEEVLGYPTEEMIGRSYEDFIHPDDIQRSGSIVDQCRNHLNVNNFVNRYLTRDGEIRHIEWSARYSGDHIFAAARDITPRVRGMEFEKELMHISAKLAGVSYQEIGAALNLSLHSIGQFLGVDRSYIFEFDLSGLTFSNTYEWCNQGINPEIDNLQNIPVADFPFWFEKINNREIILIPSVADLPERLQLLKEALQAQDIQSLAAFPIYIEGVPVGFLGLDSVRTLRQFTESEINTLILWAGLIASLINKRSNEKLLEQTRQNYETFFNTLEDFIFVVDLSGYVVHFNSIVSKRLGFAKEELTGQPVLKVFPPERHDEAWALLKEIEAGKLDNFSIPLITRSGDQIPVETNARPGFWNGQPIWFSVSKDISQIKISEEKFSAAFRSSPAMIAISGFDDGHYIDVNHAFIETIGYEREELIGKTNAELGLFYDVDYRSTIIENIRYNRPVRKQEVLIRTKSGGIVTGLLSADSIFIGNRRCLLTVTMDISERKKLEQEMIVARLEAEKANMAKSDFLSRMSHELRTPLNSILGFSQLLDMGELNPSQKKGVNYIKTSGKHLLDLINEVLDISKIESGNLTLSLEPVHIGSVITEMTDIVQPLTVEKNITVEVVECPLNDQFVRADRQRLKQILLNLVTNAIKYNKPGGSVSMRVEVLPRHPNGFVPVRLIVSDTGVGIDPSDIPKLFIPFARFGDHQHQTEGTGLGLPVAKKLADAMGGHIGVKSRQGSGSDFWIELPLCEGDKNQENDSLVPDDRKAARPEIRGTIMYIEDNLSNIELVEQILASQRSGIRLITTMTGATGLKMARDLRPDLILLDVNLPDLHGSDVLERLMADELTSNIPVVIISADAMMHQLHRLINAGARHYLTKPLNLEEMLKIIDLYIAN